MPVSTRLLLLSLQKSHFAFHGYSISEKVGSPYQKTVTPSMPGPVLYCIVQV